MKTRFVACALAVICCLLLPFSAFAEESETDLVSSASSEIEEASETEETSSDVSSLDLPTPVIDRAYFGEDDDGNTIIFVEGTPHEDLAEIDAYLAEHQSYPIRVEFYVNINNEGFVKTSSRGERASDGVYSLEIPVSYNGKRYDSDESYFQIRMRYVYDYDWIRISQSEWSNTLELNPQLSGIDLQKQADMAGTVTTLLWVGGLVVLVVLLVVMFSGGDRRCPHCRARVPKKQTVCAICGYDFKTKKVPQPDPAEEKENATSAE